MGGHLSGFSRLRAPVVFLRAVAEDSSLFNFSFDDEHDGAAYGACISRGVAALALPERGVFAPQFTGCNGRTAVTSYALSTATPITSRC